jgi:hypothetical protein
MKLFAVLGVLFGLVSIALSDAITVKSAPPVVVKTVPEAGSTDVDPDLKEIKVTFRYLSEGGWRSKVSERQKNVCLARKTGSGKELCNLGQ